LFLHRNRHSPREKLIAKAGFTLDYKRQQHILLGKLTVAHESNKSTPIFVVSAEKPEYLTFGHTLKHPGARSIQLTSWSSKKP